MALNVEVVAEKVFNLLAGNGYDISNLDSKGDKVIDPQDATRFVVVNPNILVRLDKATETLSMGVREDFDDDNLREAFKSLAGDYLMNFDYRIFGKQLKPKSETIDIAQKSEKNMGDVLEAINELRKLSGMETLEEYSVAPSVKLSNDFIRWCEEKRMDWPKLRFEFNSNPSSLDGLLARYEKETGEAGIVESDDYELDEKSKGLYYNVNKRKKAGTSRSKNHPKAPSKKDWENAAKTAKESVEEAINYAGSDPQPEQNVVDEFADVDPKYRTYYIQKWAEKNGINSDDAMFKAGYVHDGYIGAGAWNWRYVGMGESVNESDQLNEFQQFDPNVLNQAYDLLNKEQTKIYNRQGRTALLKTYSRSGRERLAKVLYKRGLTNDYRSSLALVNMYFDNSDIKSSVEHTGKPIEELNVLRKRAGLEVEAVEDNDYEKAYDFEPTPEAEAWYNSIVDHDDLDNMYNQWEEAFSQADTEDKVNVALHHVQGLLADGPLDDYNTLWQAWEQDEDIEDMLPKYQAMAKKSAGTPELPIMGEAESVEEYNDRPSLDTDLPSDYFDKLAMVKKSIFSKYGNNDRVQMIISRLNDEEKANGRKADPHNIMMKVSAHLGESAQWEKIEEGFSPMSGSTKTSYQGLDNVKLVIRHKKEVNEEIRGSRSRNISSIFVQRGDERFKMAENNLKAARAMARHVKNGGEPFDAVGSAINEMAVEQRKLREFIRYVKKSGLVNEDNESFVNLAVENINYITSAFTKLAGVKSYATAVEDVTDRRNTEVLQDDIDLESKFTETHFDDKVANVVDFVKSAMSRKTAYESYIDKAVSNESFAQLKNMLSEDDGMEFATPHAKLGYQVSQMSNSVNDPRLGNYLTGISKKLYSGDRMSQHEYTTIKSCLLGAHGTQSAPTSVAESVEDQYEKFIEQFDIL